MEFFGEYRAINLLKTLLKLRYIDSKNLSASRNEGRSGGAMQGLGKFSHRVNDDGTIDSICPQCFKTVATATQESDLDPAESRHCCDPFLIEYFYEHAHRGEHSP